MSSTFDTSSSTAQLGVDLAEEMRRRWHTGERATAENFLAAHPELYDHPEAAIDLVYEEFCLRQMADDQNVEESILRHYPQWAGPLRVMFDCHRQLLDSQRDRTRFPEVGDRVEDFRLVSELARGAHGRVFLAAQTALADRPVILKITPLRGAEHQSLARLQHTHIVPLHSVVDDPARGLRILCMPYFGRATLASLLESLRNTPHADRRGTHILQAIDVAADSTTTGEMPGPVRQMLANVSYAQAMCWIAASLADALDFAHERGLVHLDLKPSNVLLANDGQPLLLDFHLAREPIQAAGARPDQLGGTPAYMPPEQCDAMRAMENATTILETVDRRADLYSLGAILYESLGGSLPRNASSPPLTRVNPKVSRGLKDIIDKCMAERAVDRYPDAGALADDLRRHLTDQPLAGVSNGSLTERWQKWRRRQPGAFRVVAIIAISALAGSPLLVGQRLRDHIADAARTELALQVRQAAEEIRALYCSDAIAPERLRALTAHCESLWQRRDAVLAALPDSHNLDARADLQDIAVCTASLELRAAAEARSDPQRQHALRLMDEAEASFGRSAVIEYERQNRTQTGNSRGADASSSSQHAAAPRTAWEYTAIGRALLRRGELSAADAKLKAAVALEPAGRWCNFYSGVCAYRMGRLDDAVTAFSVSIGSGADLPEFFHNRSEAYRALGRLQEARRDSDRAALLSNAPPTK